MREKNIGSLRDSLENLSTPFLAPLDLIPHTDFREKCIDLVLKGIPENVDQQTFARFHDLRRYLLESAVEDCRVVVFGGGTGLSNIIGGDSRQKSWLNKPFTGLKDIFPQTRSIVCVTDDGGSTGELIKDLPLIALGDIRHVLLSSIQAPCLQHRYNLTFEEARRTVARLAEIMNSRFSAKEIDRSAITEVFKQYSAGLPLTIRKYFKNLIENLFTDTRLAKTMKRSHCLGNLLLASAVYQLIPPDLSNSDLEKEREAINKALGDSIKEFSRVIGAQEGAVLPCTATPSQLRIAYANGVEATGECKSGMAARGYPVDRVVVDFSDDIFVFEEIIKDIEAADIILLAPGSLYSSIIPIFQVPGIAEAVRRNEKAHKILIANLWAQAGETDIALSDPDRKFRVSDMINAYEYNIPGGTLELFHEVLCLSLKDVPASIIQNYALEGKIPIYLDKALVNRLGYTPLECGIYSKKALSERHVIQHDPEMVAQAVKAVYLGEALNKSVGKIREEPVNSANEKCLLPLISKPTLYPSYKYRHLQAMVDGLPITYYPEKRADEEVARVRGHILDIIWKHKDIPLSHLAYLKGVVFIAKGEWRREQKWDKVYSFFDPDDFYVKIRADQINNLRNLEIAVLIAIGQSLLGNYAKEKRMENIRWGNNSPGKVYNLKVCREDELTAFFNGTELAEYLELARMCRTAADEFHFTRLINGEEGFTPPGVLMGLVYAWYLDNRLASHIEYKMSLMKIGKSDLIPEQLKLLKRRNAIIDFFREKVFKADVVA